MAAVNILTSATNGQSNTIIGCNTSVVQLHKLVDIAYDDHTLYNQENTKEKLCPHLSILSWRDQLTIPPSLGLFAAPLLSSPEPDRFCKMIGDM